MVARNWLKRVFDTLTDMDIEDDLKLKVASRLIDKSAATWWNYETSVYCFGYLGFICSGVQ